MRGVLSLRQSQGQPDRPVLDQTIGSVLHLYDEPVLVGYRIFRFYFLQMLLGSGFPFIISSSPSWIIYKSREAGSPSWAETRKQNEKQKLRMHAEHTRTKKEKKNSKKKYVGRMYDIKSCESSPFRGLVPKCQSSNALANHVDTLNHA